jgi:endonuclease-3 related protein
VLTRHELVVEEAGYDDLKEIVERDLPRDAATYRDLHAVIVAVGKERCRKKPLCEGCPLERFLPGSRPRPGR